MDTTQRNRLVCPEFDGGSEVECNLCRVFPVELNEKFKGGEYTRKKLTSLTFGIENVSPIIYDGHGDFVGHIFLKNRY